MYYYVLVLLSFGCFLISNLKIKNRAGNLVGASYLLFSTIFIVSSTRYGIGSDYFSYKDIFDYETSTEPLFSLVRFLTKSICGNYSVFVAIIFCLSFGVKLFVFNKLCYKRGVYLCVMLFCSFYYIAYEMNAMRQGVALSFSLLATYYAYIERKKQFYVTCIAACLFHYTALIFIPFYSLLKIKVSKLAVISVCLICFILSLNNSFETILDWCMKLLGDGIISYKIQAYSTDENFANNVLISFGTIRRLFFFSLILFSYEKIEAPERMKQIVFWGGFTTIIIYLLFAEVGYFSTRLSAYYRILECIWLSYFPFIFKKKSTQYFVVLFYLFYSLLQIHSALSTVNHNLLPIRTVLFGNSF